MKERRSFVSKLVTETSSPSNPLKQEEAGDVSDVLRHGVFMGVKSATLSWKQVGVLRYIALLSSTSSSDSENLNGVIGFKVGLQEGVVAFVKLSGVFSSSAFTFVVSLLTGEVKSSLIFGSRKNS